MKVSCHYCRKQLPRTAPRLAVNGHWVCGDCAYLDEHPDAVRLEVPAKVDPKHPQDEELVA